MKNLQVKKKRASFITSKSVQNPYSTGCSWDSLNWSCAYESIIMGLYSFFNNVTTSCQLEWSIQSTLTHFLAKKFDSINANLTEPHKNNHFNYLCNDFRNKLNYIDAVKFPRFGTYLVAIDEIISVLCNDNLIGRQMKCLSYEKNVSILFQKCLNPHLWTKHAEATGYSPSLDMATIQEWSFISLTECKTISHPPDHKIFFVMCPAGFGFKSGYKSNLKQCPISLLIYLHPLAISSMNLIL